jgi:hypothetical protein
VTVDHAGACSNKNPAGDVADDDDDTKEGGVIQERSAQEDDKGPML